MSHDRLVHSAWNAVRRGDLDALQAALTPDATWRAVEDGPWNCQSREAILDFLGPNLQRGLSGEVEEVIDVGRRSVVAFRPSDHRAGGWPLDHGVRYVVLSFRDALISELKGCANRQAALAYAAAQ